MRNRFFFHRIVCVLALIQFVSLCGQTLPKALLLTGNGNANGVMEGYPPWMHEFHNEEVAKILEDVAEVHVTEDLSDLNAKNLVNYDLVISNSIFLTPTPEQLYALYDFISEGKPLLTLHCGILSFLNWERYEEVLGGIFIGGPAIEPERFEVSTTNMEFWGYSFSFRDWEEHPVSAAVNDFTIEDELYYFQPNTSDFFVIARANNHPVMWWHPVNRGKVMSLTLGHSLEAKANEGYRELLRNGVQWLLGYPLLGSVTLKPVSSREEAFPAILDMQSIVHGTGALTFGLEENQYFRFTDRDKGIIGMYPGDFRGTHTLTLRATDAQGRSAEREIEARVIEDGQGNIASYYGNTATVSSTEPANYLFHPDHLIDGDLNTRWASGFTDPQWIQIDLQKLYDITTIKLHWEASHATAYTVEISEDGEAWKTVAEVQDADGGIDTIDFARQAARYVRVRGTERARELYGYSLFEVEVFGED